MVETRSKWDVNGRGVQVERLTSLAQNKGREDMTTGEYFLGSKWLNMYIATSQETKLWEPGLTSERTLYPKNSPVVKVNTIHADYEEAVDIDYR